MPRNSGGNKTSVSKQKTEGLGKCCAGRSNENGKDKACSSIFSFILLMLTMWTAALDFS